MTHTSIEYKLIRSRRRTLALEIARDAALVIRAPHHFDLPTIHRIIEEKKEWILKKQRFYLEKQRSLPIKKYKEGETFLYLGQEYPLKIADQAEALRYDGAFYLSQNYHQKAKQLLIQWYKDQAYQLFASRAGYYSYYIGVKFGKLKLSNAKSRWGACTRSGNIRLSWRLIMAPLWVIDYVIIHELTHILEHNHSKRFWSKIEALYPEYKKCKRWLKENDHRLVL